ncbi:MAG TPA: nickel-dependent hydrogenase large subunit, partial [Desulfobacteria bacterium]|nr:nickel-dependent hydrogenase large subunit [Desulfobacteria bacterium]
HFRFSVRGEYIINLEAQLFYTHRGIEKLAEGMDVFQAIPLVERICGVCSYSHSTSYCQAVEAIAGTEIPDRAKYIRTIVLELERLYNHLGDVGNICAGTGFTFAISQGTRLKEIMMQLNERIAGNRYLRGINVPGGVQLDIGKDISFKIRETLAAVAGEFRELKEILVNNDSFVERLTGTGILTPEIALKLNVVGPGGRASGIRRDVRRNHPHAAYENMEFEVPCYTEGDVKARFLVRLDEIEESFKIVTRALEEIPDGKLKEALGPIEPYSYALGYTESPRGENIHWVMAGPGNTIFRYRVRSASFTNWPAVAAAVPGNMVPDFPLINKSFELCYSCLDR